MKGMFPKMNKGEEKKTAPSDVKISLTKRKAKIEKKRRIIRLAIFISSASVIIMLILVTLFLKINKVKVTGNSLYKEEEIIKVLQAEKGKNILTFNTGEAERRLKKEFPSFNEVKIKKKLPSEIVIEIKQTDEVLYTAVGERYYSLNSELKVIKAYESMEEAEMLGLIRIYFPEVTRCVTGEIITTRDSDIQDMVKQLYAALEKHGILYDVTEIDFRDKFTHLC